MTRDEVILPGATLGVFGDGQLGRMFAVAAARLGYRVAVFAPDLDGPASQVAHLHVRGEFDDDDAVRRFASSCDAITTEWENVPVRALETAAELACVRPGPRVLATAQNRLAEREFLDAHGLPTAPHAAVRCVADLEAALRALGGQAVLKSARFGYDGRGQRRVRIGDDATVAWRELGTDSALCEAWIEHRREVSVLVARGHDGAVETFGPIENVHANHILDVSTYPASGSKQTAARAVELARTVAEALELEGLMCVEMFELGSGQLLINELAPRPHNSGHLTIEACNVSQFEQQVRALCGLPLAKMTSERAAAMANVLGEAWGSSQPVWGGALGIPAARLHVYGKQTPAPGRKMGHLTALAATVTEARDCVMLARAALAGRREPSAAIC